MDPYQFAQQQGQVAGSSQQPDDTFEAEDLMDLLIHAFNVAGGTADMSAEEKHAVVQFAVFSNVYLAEHRVVSTGVVNGEFSLVFEDGQAVALATTPETAPARPESVVPITTPKASKMKGMPVVDNSVAITSGTIGSPTRRPK